MVDTSNFKSGCQIPAKRNVLSEKNCKRGRPKDTLLEEAYSKVCTLFEEKGLNDEQVTVGELANYMKKLVPESDRDEYAVPYLKKHMLNDYKDQVIVNNVDGRPDVITFVSTASKILQDFHKNNSNNQNIEDEKNAYCESSRRYNSKRH